MSFIENIVVDVAGAITGVSFLSLQVAKNMRITNSKIECYIAIHDYLKTGSDTTDIERYFLDSSECDQKSVLDKLKSCSGHIQKKIDCLQKEIKEKDGSCFGMFSSRKTKDERLADAIDLKFRIDDLCCVLEKAEKKHTASFKAA